MGLGFQALHAARLTKDGHGLENVLAELNVIREKIKLFAMLDSTTQLKRSGRVSWTRSIVSDLLRIKPFIQLKEGNVLRHGFSRTRSSGKKKLEQLLTSFGNMEYLAVLHTNAYQEAQLFLELVKERVDFQPLIINVTTIIGNHVGSKGLGFVCLPA